MTYNLTPEQMAFLQLARICWQKRGTAKRLGLGFGEESVTETILLELAESFPGDVFIVPFNKPQEGKLGADWAWAFTSSDNKYVYPMLVQAKALDFDDRSYPEIKRNIGKSLPPVRQIDRLIATAAGFGWPAIYAFYNHLDDAARIPHACASLAMSGSSHYAPAWGISVAYAEQVRAVLNDQTFDTHRMHSIALHCLLCSRGTGARPPEGSARLALNGIARLRTAGEPAGELGPWKDRPAETLKELPSIFVDALSLLQSDDGEARDIFRQELAERYPSVAGVVILRDAVDGSENESRNIND